MLEVKFNLNANEVIRRNSWQWVCWHCHCQTLAMQPQDLSKGELIHINEKHFRLKGWRYLRESAAHKTFSIKGTYREISRTKDKMVDADSNLERSMRILQEIGKTYVRYCKLWNKKKARTAQTIFRSFYKEIIHFNSQDRKSVV